ncbi:MAG: ERAP1-like C-terminal domain-containing protein, partial [Myxococcota bacterium]
GYPLLRVTMSDGGGHTRVSIAQQRHFARGRPTGPGGAVAAETRWPIPICLKFDAGRGREVRCELLDGAPSGEWDLPAAPCVRWLFPNAGQGGFYRAALPQPWLDALARHVGVDLSPEERIGLLDDQWALVESGDATAPDFLALVAGYRDERTRPVLEAIAGRLHGIRDRYVATDARERYQRFVQRTLGPAFAELGWDPAPGEDEERKIARDAVVGALGQVARATDVLAEASLRAAAYRADPNSLDPTLATTVVHLAAIHGDARLYDDYFARMKRAKVPEERDRFLYALAAFEDAALLARTLEAALGADVRKQDVGRVIGAVIRNPAGRARGWAFVRERFDSIHARASQRGMEGVIRALGAICDAESRREVADFFAAHPMEETRRALAETLEAIDLCIDVRAREEARIATWLAQERP